MNLTRRSFIETAAGTAAAFATPGCATAALDAAAPVDVLAKTHFAKPGEKIRMGFIGSGGRGGANLNEFFTLGEEIVALCDVDATRLDGAAKKISARCPKARRYRDWRELLDREKDLDAVVVSTPDHMHAAAAIAAMKRGLHVYVEKPLVRTFFEAERFRKVAEACGVVTQMGNNGNGTDGQRRNIEILQSGVLGDISEIHVTTDRPIWPQAIVRPEGSDTIPDTFDWNLWLGVAPKRPFKKGVYHGFKWRGWFDFGTGAMGDIACHAMSFFWRGLALERVLSAETIKTTPRFAETYPAATTVKLVVTSARQKNPVEIFWYDGKTGPDEATARRLTDGVMSSLGGTTIVGANGVFRGGTLMLKGERKFIRWQDHPATRDLPVTLPRVKNHHWEFAEAVRGGAKPFSHVDHSVPLTEAVLLGCISQRVPGKLVWDAAKGRFANSEEANALLVPYVRPGWEIG